MSDMLDLTLVRGKEGECLFIDSCVTNGKLKFCFEHSYFDPVLEENDIKAKWTCTPEEFSEWWKDLKADGWKLKP